MLWIALDLGGCFLVSYEEQIIGILATPFEFTTNNIWKNLYGKGELEPWEEVTSTYWAIPSYDLTRSLIMYTSCIGDVIMALFYPRFAWLFSSPLFLYFRCIYSIRMSLEMSSPPLVFVILILSLGICGISSSYVMVSKVKTSPFMIVVLW